MFSSFFHEDYLLAALTMSVLRFIVVLPFPPPRTPTRPAGTRSRRPDAIAVRTGLSDESQLCPQLRVSEIASIEHEIVNRLKNVSEQSNVGVGSISKYTRNRFHLV